MNKTIKDMAVQSNLCESTALEDPEGYDSYKYYDNLQLFVESVKHYYMSRAANQCVDICRKMSNTQGTADGVAAEIKTKFNL